MSGWDILTDFSTGSFVGWRPLRTVEDWGEQLSVNFDRAMGPLQERTVLHQYMLPRCATLDMEFECVVEALGITALHFFSRKAPQAQELELYGVESCSGLARGRCRGILAAFGRGGAVKMKDCSKVEGMRLLHTNACASVWE